ncbi:hypothetical protein BLOT_003958 [Blomia tropicalis]|nr:hypothetical protein BLOT_003958 [Blomia tropicalis]
MVFVKQLCNRIIMFTGGGIKFNEFAYFGSISNLFCYNPSCIQIYKTISGETYISATETLEILVQGSQF